MCVFVCYIEYILFLFVDVFLVSNSIIIMFNSSMSVNIYTYILLTLLNILYLSLIYYFYHPNLFHFLYFCGCFQIYFNILSFLNSTNSILFWFLLYWYWHWLALRIHFIYLSLMVSLYLFHFKAFNIFIYVFFKWMLSKLFDSNPFLCVFLLFILNHWPYPYHFIFFKFNSIILYFW